jgi:hypothetical protein
MTPRKPPVKRLFTGAAGSALARIDETVTPQTPSEASPKKRGRRPKYKSDEERKAADKQRKRDERVDEAAQEIIDAHPDQLGSHGESSGGFSPQKIERVVAAQQGAEAIGLGTDRDPNAPELGTPDRRHVSAVPVSADNDTSKHEESDSTFVNNAIRRQTRALHVWIHGSKKRICSQNHAKLAEGQKNSRTKVYCAVCRKLLVRPGKVLNSPDRSSNASN